MLTNTQIKNRRDAILLEMQGIRQMLRGHISQQTLTRTGPDGSIQKRGPYFTFQRWIEGRNRSERISKEDLPPLQRAVEGYQQFSRLADEFAQLTGILTERSGPLLPSKKTPDRSPRRKISGNRGLPQNRSRANRSGKGGGFAMARGRVAQGAVGRWREAFAIAHQPNQGPGRSVKTGREMPPRPPRGHPFIAGNAPCAAQLLHPGDKPAATRLYEHWRGKIAESKIEEVLREARAHLEQMVPESATREGLQKKINYLENQKERWTHATVPRGC